MELKFRKHKAFSILDFPKFRSKAEFLELRKEIEKLPPDKTLWIAFNLSELRTPPSDLISLSLFTKKLLDKRGGKFCIVCPNNEANDLFEATGVRGIFHIYENEADLEG